jgi:hypothetical protein
MQYSPISLETPPLFPNHITPLIEPLKKELLSAQPIHNITSNEKYTHIIETITEHLEQSQVIGFHHTRAEPETISNGGLICRSGQEQRTWFLDNYGQLFSAAEIMEIKTAWDQYFTREQTSARDHRIFFTFTKIGLQTGDANRLLENFGGEAVYMPLDSLSSVSKKIKSIGVPLIVSFKIQPSRTYGFWGKHAAAIIWLSKYRHQINPEASQIDTDAHTRSSIPIDDIITIESLI